MLPAIFKTRKRITKISLYALIVFGLLAPLSATVGAQVEITPDDFCSGANFRLDTQSGQCVRDETGAESNPETTLNSLIENIINIITLIVGIIAVIMIIYGGFRYITSGGNQEGISSAKSTVIYGIIGLIIVALAQVIVRFVISQATDATQ